MARVRYVRVPRVSCPFGENLLAAQRQPRRLSLRALPLLQVFIRIPSTARWMRSVSSAVTG
eukprot:6512-Prymnesium_polylepis.1